MKMMLGFAADSPAAGDQTGNMTNQAAKKTNFFGLIP
jgi:hypothetical protein